MKIVTPDQMKEIDRIAISDYKIPGLRLMANAGQNTVLEMEKRNLDFSNSYIFCGKGNNGGDGFVIARLLKNRGYDPKVILLSKKEEVKGDANVNLGTYLDLEPSFVEYRSIDDIKELGEPTLIVDAIFGTGLISNPKGINEEVIEWINNQKVYTVAVDIPSGLSGKTGCILGLSVNADLTVTFGQPKIGLYVNDGINVSGEVVVSDIGIPYEIVDKFNLNKELIHPFDIKKILKKRKRNSHKGNYGHLAIVAGSYGKTGALKMASRSSFLSGCGLVTLYAPLCISNTIENFCFEEMACYLKSNETSFKKNDFFEIEQLFMDKSAIVFGPGITVTEDIKIITKRLVKNSKIPIVIDADGLNALSDDPDVLKEKQCEIILTPHLGEMERLTGRSVKEIVENKMEIAAEFAKNYNVYLVLKGFRTIVATPNGKVYLNLTGNPGMATAGMGDVLSGMIASFICQQYSACEAAILGVYFHGLAGDIAKEDVGESGLVAGTLIEYIPEVLMKYE